MFDRWIVRLGGYEILDSYSLISCDSARDVANRFRAGHSLSSSGTVLRSLMIVTLVPPNSDA